jgi:nicotinate phosphoribosyltransferase
MLRDWEAKYGPDLLVALSDTFTSDFFFEDFDQRQAKAWQGLRHDSGDPLEFAEKTIDFYRKRGVDPTVKSIMFSDALDVGKVAAIRAAVQERIGNRYGVGTKLTNNLGLLALNVVMKATHVRLADGREADTVKLSDNPGKHTGPEALVRRYKAAIFNTAQERSAS